MDHQVPGTYILRHLSDVAIPEPVSWWPQTVGWKVLLAVAILFAVYLLYRQCRQWWLNRYRREALDSLRLVAMSSSQADQDILAIIKIVLVYLEPRCANLFGQPLLAALDAALPASDAIWFTPLGERWLESVISQKTTLTADHVKQLELHCRDWLAEHDARYLKAHMAAETAKGEGDYV
ncbi:hypothetical protein BIT28_10300 [Photobacterium proteolyticum]|uniref:DUF4381 domain-containing protein n=1 Tax=Photobacterium proteolyticum TaxID=1903952 RepID=A0A1Q9G6H9_9GAMM|nr:DUF4381 domain-containing protein [Photobacterium proteolyticum]OLQ69933.1 hypothetical protein BIT28_10300 [Photobacterium proteolyticum]